jgi:putative phosphoribosyl transferase
VAARLHAPLDVRVVRKLGLPHQPELAMGAVAGGAEGLQVVRNPDVIARGRVSEDVFAHVLDREVAELRRREELYRGSRPPVALRERAVIVVDDGLATGASLRVALRVIHEEGPGEVVVAIPIGPAEGCAALAEDVDDLVCPWLPTDFNSVGQGYVDFAQTTNDEVRRLLSHNSG